MCSHLRYKKNVIIFTKLKIRYFHFECWNLWHYSNLLTIHFDVLHFFHFQFYYSFDIIVNIGDKTFLARVEEPHFSYGYAHKSHVCMYVYICILGIKYLISGCRFLINEGSYLWVLLHGMKFQYSFTIL